MKIINLAKAAGIQILDIKDQELIELEKEQILREEKLQALGFEDITEEERARNMELFELHRKIKI